MMKVCSECGKEITGEVIKYDGKVICQQCCDNILGLNGLSGKNPDGMMEKDIPDDPKICKVCGKATDGNVTIDGKGICKECYKKLDVENKSGVPWLLDDVEDDDEIDLDDDEEDGFPDEYDEEADEDDDTDSGEDSEDDDASEDNASTVHTESATEVTEAMEEKVGEPTITDLTDEPIQTENPPKNESVIDELAGKTGKKVKEKITDPDSFGQRFNRWVKLRFKGYVTLKTLSRDPKNGGMILRTDIIKKKDLPKDAVQCTNESGTYCLDTIKTSSWYAESRFNGYQPNQYEAQFKASDACLYMESKVFDNALSVHWTDWSHVDIKKVMLIAFVVLCAIAFLILRVL